MKEKITLESVIEFVKNETSLTKFNHIIEIYNELNNKEYIFKIIKILNKDELLKKDFDYNQDILNRKDIESLFQKIMKLIEDYKKSIFTIQYPNDKMISINANNFNFLEDTELLFEHLNYSVMNYDILANPIIIAKLDILNLKFNSKEVHEYTSFLVTPNSVKKQDREETEQMLKEFVVNEEHHFIFS